MENKGQVEKADPMNQEENKGQVEKAGPMNQQVENKGQVEKAGPMNQQVENKGQVEKAGPRNKHVRKIGPGRKGWPQEPCWGNFLFFAKTAIFSSWQQNLQPKEIEIQLEKWVVSGIQVKKAGFPV